MTNFQLQRLHAAQRLRSFARQPKKSLYAIAAIKLVDCRWIAEEMTYVHALDVANAKFEFLCTLTDQERLNTQILFAGIVIGYHVHDDHGERLSV
jgi:hypothetical protein